MIRADIFDFWSTKIHPLWSWNRCLARIVSLMPEASGLTLSLRVNHHHNRLPSDGRLRLVVRERGGLCSYEGRVIHATGHRIRLQLRQSHAFLQPGTIVELQPPEQPLPNSRQTRSGTRIIRLARSGRTLPASSRRTLLLSLEQAGLQPRFGCRRGLCNQCACTRLYGRTFNLRGGQPESQPGQPVRICTSIPETDLVLDL